MEPTVFCLVVPMMFNICSDPLIQVPSREKRSIILNTGNDSNSPEGRIVNTALTDKQLVINIETKVLPQFNVYLDSLAQSPRMQCTTNDDKINGDITKRIFTCIPLPTGCCSSPLVCTCSENAADPTLIHPYGRPTKLPDLSLVPNTPNCFQVCISCPAKSIYLTTTAFPDQNNFCQRVCKFCLETTPIPQTTAATSPLEPSSSKCKELCQQCSLKSLTTTVPPTTQSINNCTSICEFCPKASTEQTLTISTTAITSTILPTLAPEYCQQVCSSCIPNTKPTDPAQCRDICSKCTSTTAVLVPGTPSCENLCQTCKSRLVQCIDVCKNCKVPPILNCPALCDKCYTKPVPNSQNCKQICTNCQPVVSPTPQDKCISCKVLCKMCSFKRHYRMKRDVNFEAEKSLPLVVNIERVNRSDDPCGTKTINPLSSFNPEFRYTKQTPADIEKCKNFAASRKLNAEKCTDCHSLNQFASFSENIPSIDLKICPNLCKKCTLKRTLKPGSQTCVNLCKNCRDKHKPPTPNTYKCFDLCKKCINSSTSPIIKPDPSKQCKVYCHLCKQNEKHISSTTSTPEQVEPTLLVPNLSKCLNLCHKCNKKNVPILRPNSKQCQANCQKCRPDENPTSATEPNPPKPNSCFNLCKKCMNRNATSELEPNSKQCKTHCQMCKDGSPTQAGLPDSCEQYCLYCKHARLTSTPPHATPSPWSTECNNICSLCKKAGRGKSMKITRTNCTHSNVTN